MDRERRQLLSRPFPIRKSSRSEKGLERGDSYYPARSLQEEVVGAKKDLDRGARGRSAKEKIESMGEIEGTDMVRVG